METLCSFRPVGSCSMCVCVWPVISYLSREADRLRFERQKLSFELRGKNIRICNVFLAFKTLLNDWIILASALMRVQFLQTIINVNWLSRGWFYQCMQVDQSFWSIPCIHHISISLSNVLCLLCQFSIVKQVGFNILPKSLTHIYRRALTWHFKCTPFHIFFGLKLQTLSCENV